jgi:tryptophan-rich sensory protein
MTTANSLSSPWPVQVAFALLPLLVGQGLAGASVALFGPPSGAETNLLPPVVFALAWLGLYPTLGMASLRVFEAAPSLTRSTAIRVGWVFLVFSWAWMPIACSTGNPWIPVGLDLGASAIFAVAAVTYVRTTKNAGRWLLPTALWMPVTTALSLHAAITA